VCCIFAKIHYGYRLYDDAMRACAESIADRNLVVPTLARPLDEILNECCWISPDGWLLRKPLADRPSTKLHKSVPALPPQMSAVLIWAVFASVRRKPATSRPRRRRNMLCFLSRRPGERDGVRGFLPRRSSAYPQRLPAHKQAVASNAASAGVFCGHTKG
jgi:hypothetical protein